MADKKPVLITAFKPWNGRPSNITGEIVMEAAEELKRIGAESHVLDVSYAAIDEFTHHLDISRYSRIISLGIMRQNNPPIRFEVQARKTSYKPDDRNMRPQFNDSAAGFYVSTEAMLYAKQNPALLPYDIGMSHDAGGFVCEYTLYRMLEKTHGTDTQAVFIHFSNRDKDEKKAFLLDYLDVLNR